MSPSQLSEAVRFTGGGTSSAHSRFRLAGADGGTGAKVSATTIVWVTLLVLPHVSENVQVRTMVKSFGQKPEVTSTVGPTVVTPLQSIADKSSGGGTSSAHPRLRSGGIGSWIMICALESCKLLKQKKHTIISLT